jgi:hypothetical protein
MIKVNLDCEIGFGERCYVVDLRTQHPHWYVRKGALYSVCINRGGDVMIEVEFPIVEEDDNPIDQFESDQVFKTREDAEETCKNWNEVWRKDDE